MVACHADDISFGSWWSVKRLLKLCNASFSRNLLLRHDLSAVLQRDADTPSLQPALAYDALLGTNLPVVLQFIAPFFLLSWNCEVSQLLSVVSTTTSRINLGKHFDRTIQRGL